jgi:hypothetical protein
MTELGTNKTPKTSIDTEHFDALIDSLRIPLESVKPHEQGSENGPNFSEKLCRIRF